RIRLFDSVENDMTERDEARAAQTKVGRGIGFHGRQKRRFSPMFQGPVTSSRNCCRRVCNIFPMCRIPWDDKTWQCRKPPQKSGEIPLHRSHKGHCATFSNTNGTE